ncbi:MAG: hypothetical protein IIY70_02660 [Oscillospiraceae bacterium]|nr:hypothetical protein [Oscillospiraceae bacterium]
MLPTLCSVMIFPHYIGIVIGLFNYPIFTNSTLRNQLAIGHRRSQIFLADWAASNVFAVSLYLLLSLSIYATAAVVSTPEIVAWDNVLFTLVLSTLQVILFTTVAQLFCVILKGVKSFLAIYLGNQLLALAGIGLMAVEHIPQALLYFFPTAICMQTNCFRDPTLVNPLLDEANGLSIAASTSAMHFDFLPAAAAVLLEIAIVYLIGLCYFRKTDLN